MTFLVDLWDIEPNDAVIIMKWAHHKYFLILVLCEGWECCTQHLPVPLTFVLFSVNTHSWLSAVYCDFICLQSLFDRRHPVSAIIPVFGQIYCMQMFLRTSIMLIDIWTRDIKHLYSSVMLCNIVRTVILPHLLYTSVHSDTLFVALCCFVSFFLYLNLFYCFVSKLLVAVAVAVSLFCAFHERPLNRITK